MAYIFARTERDLEAFCKIKDNNLSFEWMSFWIFELGCFSVDEFLSWGVCKFVNLWVNSSGVVRLSWVYKPVSWLVLHSSQFIEILIKELRSYGVKELSQMLYSEELRS